MKYEKMLGESNPAKRDDVRKKLRENHWSRNPLHRSRVTKIISKTHTGNKYTIGISSVFKGKTYGELY